VEHGCIVCGGEPARTDALMRTLCEACRIRLRRDQNIRRFTIDVRIMEHMDGGASYATATASREVAVYGDQEPVGDQVIDPLVEAAQDAVDDIMRQEVIIQRREVHEKEIPEACLGTPSAAEVDEVQGPVTERDPGEGAQEGGEGAI